MITAYVLYRSPSGVLDFRELDGSSFASTDPREWGLHSACEILLVLHRGQFLGAWVEGRLKDPRE